MRYRGGSSSEEPPQHPEFLIPVLVHYGFEDGITEDLGSRPIRCAFHGDKTPSANINTAAGWFNCHTHVDCPSGNAIQIVMKQENLEYVAALERAEEISRQYGVAVRRTPGRSGRMAGGTRNRSGSRALRRTWSSD